MMPNRLANRPAPVTLISYLLAENGPRLPAFFFIVFTRRSTASLFVARSTTVLSTVSWADSFEKPAWCASPDPYDIYGGYSNCP